MPRSTTRNAILASIALQSARNREEEPALIRPNTSLDERRAIILEHLSRGSNLLKEYQILSKEYATLYRANGAQARGRRRGLRFRIAEISKDPNFQHAFEAEERSRPSPPLWPFMLSAAMGSR